MKKRNNLTHPRSKLKKKIIGIVIDLHLSIKSNDKIKAPNWLLFTYKYQAIKNFEGIVQYHVISRILGNLYATYIHVYYSALNMHALIIHAN